MSVFEGVPESRYDRLVPRVGHLLGVPGHRSDGFLVLTSDDEVAPGSEAGGRVVRIQNDLEFGV